VCLEQLLARAHSRAIIHSTFLDVKRFAAIAEPIRAACWRGVQFDLLWGAEKDEETEQSNAQEATRIVELVREDRDMRGHFRIHMRTMVSHAKLTLIDTAEACWIGAVC